MSWWLRTVGLKVQGAKGEWQAVPSSAKHCQCDKWSPVMWGCLGVSQPPPEQEKGSAPVSVPFLWLVDHREAFLLESLRATLSLFPMAHPSPYREAAPCFTTSSSHRMRVAENKQQQSADFWKLSQPLDKKKSWLPHAFMALTILLPPSLTAVAEPPSFWLSWNTCPRI